MSAQEKLIDAINDVNLSQWDEVQAYMERQIADAILSSDWLAAHDAEKRAEWEAEQGETEWEGIVLGREVGGSGDWSVTVWRPDEIEEARAMFPGSEYVLGRAKWEPVPDTTNEREQA